MNERGAKLKRSSGWFAAGREVERAIGLLSDGGFKLLHPHLPQGGPQDRAA